MKTSVKSYTVVQSYSNITSDNKKTEQLFFHARNYTKTLFKNDRGISVNVEMNFYKVAPPSKI